jgi:hypothetical protein
MGINRERWYPNRCIALREVVGKSKLSMVGK